MWKLCSLNVGFGDIFWQRELRGSVYCARLPGPPYPRAALGHSQVPLTATLRPAGS